MRENAENSSFFKYNGEGGGGRKGRGGIAEGMQNKMQITLQSGRGCAIMAEE